MPMNVLITSASRKVGLVRAFQSALARCGGGKVATADTSPYSPALYLASRHFLVPPSTERCFIDEMLRLCEREDIALVVPTRDEELPLFAAARQRFEQGGTRVMVSPPEAVSICQDKRAFARFCEEHGFGAPRSYAKSEWRAPDLPLFAKPRFGKSGKGARRVFTEAGLRALLEAEDEYIVQEFVDASEYTIDLFADFGGRVLSAVPRLRQLVIGGESYVSRTVNEPKLIEEAVRLATALGLEGHNTIQAFWDTHAVKFIEVNPRFGGAVALSIAAGADTPSMLLRLVAGEAVPSQVGQFEDGLVMLRYTEDLFLKRERIAVADGRNRVAAHAEEITKGRTKIALEAVLFDLDNTLYPEEDFVRGGFRAVAEYLGAHLQRDPGALKARLLDILQEQGRGKVFDTLLAELGLDRRTWLHTLLFIYRSHRPVIALSPQVPAVLDNLKSQGLRLGLVTDGMASVQRRKIEALGLHRWLDVIVCTDELGNDCGKPSRVPFEVALTLLDIAPSRAAYVADDASKDFAGANELGMKSVRLRSKGLLGVPLKMVHDRGFQPQVEVDALNEVEEALRWERT